jgi:hypothetical protein
MQHDNPRISRAPDLITTQLGDGAVIMDIARGDFIELSRSAAQLWELLETPATMDRLCALLLERYEVQASLCARQVEAWVAQMQTRGLLLVEPG